MHFRPIAQASVGSAEAGNGASSSGLPLAVGAVGAPPQSAIAQSQNGAADELYTVFDVWQVARRLRQPQWPPAACLQDAVTHSRLPDPLGHVLLDPVVGYPQPQVHVYQASAIPAHQPLIIVFRGMRDVPLVCNFPSGSSIVDYFSNAQIGPGQPGHGVLDAPGGFTCMVHGEHLPCSAPVPPDAQTVIVALAAVAVLPDGPPAHSVEDVGAVAADLDGRAEEDRASAAMAQDGPHTCLDSIAGPRFRGKFPHWHPLDCIRDCELTATHVAQPIGRLLVYTVAGLPCPQTLVSDRRIQATHRSIAPDLRAIGMHVTVVAVRYGSLLYEIMGALEAAVRRRLQEIFTDQLGHRFFVDGVLINTAIQIPDTADVISVFPPAAAGEPPTSADMASAIWDDVPADPPPPRRWHLRRLLRRIRGQVPAHLPIALPASCHLTMMGLFRPQTGGA